MLEFNISQYNAIKLSAHVVQAICIFVSWAIEIAVFKATTSVVNASNGWYFGLCFLTVPAIIYLTMTPRFPRTRKFANPYAMATVDGVFCILWLSAFAAQAAYNTSGKCGNGCGISKAVVAFGVIIWLLFILTTWLSLYAVFYYKREGYLPGASRVPTNAQMIDPDKDAFSTAPHDDEYAPVQNTDDHDDPPGPLSHGGYGNASTAPAPYDAQSYGAGGAGGYTGVGAYMPPSVSEDMGYTGYGGAPANTGYIGATGRQSPVIGENGRVHFPTARYDNV